ncbi:MAG: AMP-binding protein [Acidimicrobiales bacterium]
MAYILGNSESQVLITSASRLDVAVDAVAQSPNVRLVLVTGVDAATLEAIDSHARFEPYETAIAAQPTEPIADEWAGTSMLYSSGTTGRPKGIIRPLPEQKPGEQMPLFTFLDQMWHYRDGMTYLSPAPLYYLWRRRRQSV